MRCRCFTTASASPQQNNWSAPRKHWISWAWPNALTIIRTSFPAGSCTMAAERVAAAGYQAVVVDLPGHGESTHVRADLRRTADLLAATTGPAAYVGYSLGGRVCLHLALMYPHIVHRLALLGATPGISDDDERAARRSADERLATHIVEVGVDAFLSEWLAQPLFAGLTPPTADLAERRANTADGLASSLHLCGTGTQMPLWGRLRELNMPVLTMAGALDAKFLPIAEQIASTVPQGACTPIAAAGHAAHLQEPDAEATTHIDWLAATDERINRHVRR